MHVSKLHENMRSGKPCKRCVAMTSTLDGLRQLASADGYRHFDVADLHRSATNGCSCCSLLYGLYIHHVEPSDAKLDAPQGTGYWKLRSTNQLGVKESRDRYENLDYHFIRDGKKYSLSSHTLLSVRTSPGDPAEKFFYAAKFRAPLRATEFENQIRDQLNACNYSHEKCPKREKAELPTRVIDVLPRTPRLYLSRPNDRAEYVTLSYCWGGPQDLTTSTTTLNDRISAIPLSLLPPGLQDAISITRLLGFQYLWVDALCILQDSIEDKAAEIAKMAAIYRNASMTIAAANTSSVKNSFLRDIVLPATIELPFLNPDGSPGTISLGAGDIAPRDLEHLSTRAWTLQESLLSPRVLYFGNRDVTWKCLSEMANITKVNADYDKFNTYEYRRHPPFLDNFLFPDAEMFSKTTTRDTSDRFMERSKGGLTQYGVWTYMMEDYSRRSLSVQADRLPALAGIAGELQKMWQDTYIVGMWRKCFLQHLGWRAYDDRGAKLATDFQSPTWLWITPGFRVHVEPYFKFECARIRDIDVQFAQPDSSFGEILSGKIILEGEVSTLKDIEERQTSSWEHEHWDIQECVTLDRELGGEENEVNYETRFLLLGCYSQYRSHGVGLILNPFGDGTWRRIGLTYTHEDDLNMMRLMWPRDRYQPQVITVVQALQ